MLKKVFAALFLSALPLAGAPAGEVSIYTLGNDFSLFILPDSSSALINITFCVRSRGGFQSGAEEAFFELFTELFLSSADTDAQRAFALYGFTSSCDADGAFYTLAAPPGALEDVLNVIAHCAQNPLFPDSATESALEKEREKDRAYIESNAAFINGFIDETVLCSSPLSKYALISPYTKEEAKSALFYIAEKYYRPECSALFLSGDITVKEALDASRRAFGEWFSEGDEALPRTAENGALRSGNTDGRTPATQGKARHRFTLGAEGFSNDLTQVVIEYPMENIIQADIFSRAAQSENSRFKSDVIADKECGIQRAEDIHVSSIKSLNQSRLIIQALIENPPAPAQSPQAAASAPENTSAPPASTEVPEDGAPAKDADSALHPGVAPVIPQESIEESPGESGIVHMVETLIHRIAECALLSEDEFKRAKSSVSLEYSKTLGSSAGFMEEFSRYWAESGAPYAEAALSDFRAMYDAIESGTPSSLYGAVSGKEPFVFVLTGTKELSENRDAFFEAGYNVITRDEYLTPLKESAAAKDEGLLSSALESESGVKPALIPLRPADYYYFNNISSISDTRLENGIPLSVKTNPASATLAVSVRIALPDPAAKKYRSVITAALAREADIEDISCETDSFCSNIEFECAPQAFETNMQRLSEALIYGDIRPVDADILLREEDYRARMQNYDLTFQMVNKALSAIYGTELFGAESGDISPSYQALLSARNEILDASLYSITVCGKGGSRSVKDACENTLGVLKAQSERAAPEAPATAPGIKKQTSGGGASGNTLEVELSRTFTTEKTKESAPEEAPPLIPTTAFRDPALLIFFAPDDNNRALFNALLFYLSRGTQDILGEESACSVKEAGAFISASYISAANLEAPSTLFSAYETVYDALSSSLKDEKTAPGILSEIKTLWKTRVLSATESNAGTLSLMLREKSERYLDDYLATEAATEEDALKVLEERFNIETALKVISAPQN